MSEITISAVQTELHWEHISANLEMIANKVALLKGTTQIVVLPEMFTTGFSMNPAPMAEDMSGQTVSRMKEIARENKVILTGSIIAKEENAFYNRMIWMQPDGVFGFYDKRHLFGFSGEDKRYSAGNKRLITSALGWRFNLQVCYDLRFPVWARHSNPEKPEYDVLIYVANWPEVRSHAWKSLLVARAIENQCYVVGVNRCGKDGNNIYYSGDTMIVDPFGEIISQISNEEGILTYTLKRDVLKNAREKFPFLKDGDYFKLL